jgi:hypothetical protein
LAIIQAIAASVLDAPLNCSFQAPLARLPLNRATWPMCPVMLVVSHYMPYLSVLKLNISGDEIVYEIYSDNKLGHIEKFEWAKCNRVNYPRLIGLSKPGIVKGLGIYEFDGLVISEIKWWFFRWRRCLIKNSSDQIHRNIIYSEYIESDELLKWCGVSFIDPQG